MVLGSRLYKPWNFLNDNSNGSIFCHSICSLVNSFRTIKVKWVYCYSQQAPSHHNWVYVSEVIFESTYGQGLVARGTCHEQRLGICSPPTPIGGWRSNQSAMANDHTLTE